MKDNALFVLLRDKTLEGLAARGFGDVAVRQNFQPRQQGRDPESVVYLTKLYDRRHGSPGVTARLDPGCGQMTRREIQVIESAFQVMALVSERDPENDLEHTAADLAKTVAALMQGEDFRTAIGRRGVQVLRIADIRNAPFQNERDRFEFAPSFDAILTHHDEFIARDPVIDRFDFSIKRI